MMKQLIVIAVALLSIQTFAQQDKGQNKRHGMHKMHDFTPEQIATLKTKKMTLHLDLNESQQAEVKQILLENVKTRKAKMAARKAKKESGELQKPTSEERYAMANAILDHQIAMKEKMKNILNKEQFAKWEKLQAKMAHKRKQHKGKAKKRS